MTRGVKEKRPIWENLRFFDFGAFSVDPLLYFSFFFCKSKKSYVSMFKFVGLVPQQKMNCIEGRCAKKQGWKYKRMPITLLLAAALRGRFWDFPVNSSGHLKNWVGLQDGNEKLGIQIKSAEPAKLATASQPSQQSTPRQIWMFFGWCRMLLHVLNVWGLSSWMFWMFLNVFECF